VEPLYLQPLLGYRAWILCPDGGLCALNTDDIWEPQQRAECLFHRHPAPDGECECGLYAFHELEQAEEIGAALAFSGPAAIGAIAGRGTARIHAGGFRCAEAQVLALLRPDRYLSDSTREALRRAAARYRVSLLGRAELCAYASRFAASAPHDLRPQSALELRRRR